MLFFFFKLYKIVLVLPNIDAFELWCWRRLLRVPWTARRSNQSILKEISPGCSLEGLMLQLKLQYFGHLMWRADSMEKTLMLGGIGGRRRRGRQRMRWLDGITDLMHMSLGGSPTPGVYSNSCPLNRWCHPNISSSVIPFSCLQSFPASGSFSVSWFSASGGQSIGVSAATSVLPMNTQDWSSLGWAGWISLQPKDSQESSPNPQFKSINSLALSFPYSPTLTSIHDYWKNHNFDWMDLCQQSNVSAF